MGATTQMYLAPRPYWVEREESPPEQEADNPSRCACRNVPTDPGEALAQLRAEVAQLEEDFARNGRDLQELRESLEGAGLLGQERAEVRFLAPTRYFA